MRSTSHATGRSRGSPNCSDRWPQSDPIVGALADLSIGGLRFLSSVDLEIARIVKIDGSLLDAVGCVVRSVPDGQHWTVGKEFSTLCLREQRGTFVSTTA